MFKNKKAASALLFRFGRPTRTNIHSFFCPPFLAIWLSKGKVIDYRFVRKWRICVKPASEFDVLVEIPLNKRYQRVTGHFSYHSSTIKTKEKHL